MGIDIIFKLAGVGLVTAIINNILEKSDKKEIATLVTLAGLVIAITMLVQMMSGLFSNLKGIFNLF